MIYNGQEIGKEGHPYEINLTFSALNTIQSRDQLGLFPFYKRLIELRRNFPAFISNNFQEVPVTPGSFIYGFRRWDRDQNIFIVINMSQNNSEAVLSVPVNDMNLDSSKTYYMTDMLTGEVIAGFPQDFQSAGLSIEGYTTRLFLFADTIMTVVGIKDIAGNLKPEEFSLEQNYPNPFNPVTNIRFNMPSPGNVILKVYDILGSAVMEIFSGNLNAGPHSFSFKAENLSSGVYIYRIEYDNLMISKKMILLK
jgi:hypothetical protein